MITGRAQRRVRKLPPPLGGRLVRRGLWIDPSRVEGVVFMVADTRNELERPFD